MSTFLLTLFYNGVPGDFSSPMNRVGGSVMQYFLQINIKIVSKSKREAYKILLDRSAVGIVQLVDSTDSMD